MAQIHSQRAIIGISGGVDSAIAAGIYTQALGADKLLLINMPSRFNSKQTQTLAERMALSLGTDYALLPIEQGRTQLVGQMEQTGYRSAGSRGQVFAFSDFMLENIQSRERGRVLAAAAASYRGIFTCNGNKAELCVGYATFYGDLAGAFAAQADLWKFQVYQQSAYLQQLFPNAPFDQIAAIRPSAELSPNQDVTKGLGDPLIYAYHDYLLRSWAEWGDDLSLCLQHYQLGTLEEYLGCEPGLVAATFPSPAAFVADAEHWWKQYRGFAVAKRIQAPPLLALSSRPLGSGVAEAQAAPYLSADYQQLKQELVR